MATENTATMSNTADDKSPIVAALLSWFIPGVGHYYAGMETRALYVFLGVLAWYILATIGLFVFIGLLMFFVAPLIHIGAGVDAYIQTKN